MDLSDPISAVIPSLEGQVLQVLVGAGSQPMTTATISELVRRGTYTGLRAAMARLVASGTVHQTRVGNQSHYQVNREHMAWPAIECAAGLAINFRHKFYERLEEVTESTLEGWDAELKSGVLVAVFGSFARKEAGQGSDIDVLVVAPDEAPSDLVDSLIFLITTSLQKYTGNVVNVLGIGPGELTRMVHHEDPLVASWEAEARTAYGPDLCRYLRSLKTEEVTLAQDEEPATR